MKKFCFFWILFLMSSALSSQDLDLQDISRYNSITSEELEDEFWKGWEIKKTGEVRDIPAKGIRNIQFQAGSISGKNFINLEKIVLNEENVLLSLFVKDQGKTYRRIKSQLEEEGYHRVEMENFLAPFQKLVNTEFFSKGTQLFQLDTYEDAEGDKYHLILAATLEKYRQYQTLYETWKKGEKQ